MRAGQKQKGNRIKLSKTDGILRGLGCVEGQHTHKLGYSISCRADQSRNAQRMSDQSGRFVLRPNSFLNLKVHSPHRPRNRDRGTLPLPLCPIFRPYGPSSFQKQTIMCPNLLPIITTWAAESATKYHRCVFCLALSFRPSPLLTDMLYQGPSNPFDTLLRQSMLLLPVYKMLLKLTSSNDRLHVLQASHVDSKKSFKERDIAPVEKSTFMKTLGDVISKAGQQPYVHPPSSLPTA
jgi:hypothetical protein